MGIFKKKEKNSIVPIQIEETRTSQSVTFESAYNHNDLMIEEDVLKIPTVQSILELICGTIAPLPIYLYKEEDDGSIMKVTGDYREYLLNSEPNEYQNAYNFKKQWVKDYLLYGSSYTYMEKEGNDIIGLYTFPTKNITVKKYKKCGYKISNADIIYDDKDADSELYKPHELIFILKDSLDGLTSRGALYYGQDLFKMMASEEDYKQSLLNNGALPLGILKTQGRLNDSVINRLRESWSKLYSGVSNAYKTVVLEEGLEYSALALNPKDLMLDTTKDSNISDLCRLFNIPEPLVSSASNKYGSIEQNNIHYLQYTLTPIISSIESGLNKHALLEDEKENGYFFAFDISEIVRSTEKEKYDTLNTALNSGVISINEARYKLNLPPIKDDIMKWNLGAVLYYPSTGEMKIPNTGVGIEGANKENDETKESSSNEDSIEESTNNEEQ